MTSRNSKNRRKFAKALRASQSGSTDAMAKFVTFPMRFSAVTIEREQRKAELDALIAEQEADMKAGAKSRYRGMPRGAGSIMLDAPLHNDSDWSRMDTLSTERSNALTYADPTGEEAVQRSLLASVEDQVRDWLADNPNLHPSSIHGLLDGSIIVSVEGEQTYVRRFYPRHHNS